MKGFDPVAVKASLSDPATRHENETEGAAQRLTSCDRRARSLVKLTRET